MATPRNILSLDVGDRRIGVATANTVARMASPLLTLDRQQSEDIYAEINNLIIEHDIREVVVGLPRGMEGQETAQTQIAREFAVKLKSTCGLPVHMQDEAATSLAAEDKLKASGKPYEKADIDKVAASIILDDWLAALPMEVL